MCTVMKNHLSHESSPYLLQHADNPVDWYPWGEEAFDLAKKENKLIFLSIGYSTCHWCHVMERESFSQEHIGKFMNEKFVNIKVDREERPDVDAVFINFSTRTTGSAGWPLNVILTPNSSPVFAFTYIPPVSRYGSLGITELLGDIHNLWVDNPEQILKKAFENMDEMSSGKTTVENKSYSLQQINEALSQFSKTYDKTYAGFGHSMKFPSPHILSFMARAGISMERDDALKMMESTLGAMRMGGIYDHVAGGIHRYATDPGWKIPHFEKMLYDQAGLIGALSQSYIATGKSFYIDIITEITDFLSKNFLSPDGGFYTAMDADSEGKEGKYYLWKHSDIVEILKDSSETFSEIFNVIEDGNFMDEVKGLSSGENILYLNNESEEVKKFMDDGLFWLSSEIRENLKKLDANRSKRSKPLIDTKICGDLNGFMLYNLSEAYYSTGLPALYKLAKQLNTFILEKYTKDGTCLHITYENGKEVPGFFSDYAFLSMGLFRYGFATGNSKSIHEAENLMDTLEIVSRKELDKYRKTGESSFIGTLNSQEDSSMPSQFSAYERALMFQSLYSDFKETLPFSTDEALNNIQKYPSYFTSRLETELIRQHCFILKGNFKDVKEIEHLSKRLKKITKREIMFFKEEHFPSGNYSLCDSTACFVESATIDKIEEHIKNTK